MGPGRHRCPGNQAVVRRSGTHSAGSGKRSYPPAPCGPWNCAFFGHRERGWGRRRRRAPPGRPWRPWPPEFLYSGFQGWSTWFKRSLLEVLSHWPAMTASIVLNKDGQPLRAAQLAQSRPLPRTSSPPPPCASSLRTPSTASPRPWSPTLATVGTDVRGLCAASVWGDRVWGALPAAMCPG